MSRPRWFRLLLVLPTLVLLSLVLPTLALAQTDPHWGVQGDYFKGEIPSSLIARIPELENEQPEVKVKSMNFGLVRFHDNGSPSWTLDYTKADITLRGDREVNGTRYVLNADAMLRGAMVTKYINFFSTNHVSAGLATGGGAGQVEASYVRYEVSRQGVASPVVESRTLWVPAFQIMAQVDIRPVRWVSISPFYGIRDGGLGYGGAIRIHFTR
jgi:hypothetical protein